MSCICRKPRSPFWMAKFKDATGRTVMRSTKEPDAKKARKIAEQWEEAAKKARAGELTQAASIKLLSELMETSVGERLVVDTISSFLTKYAESKEGTTRKRYKTIVDEFLTMIGEKRAAASIGSIAASEIERFRDLQLSAGKSAVTANFFVVVLRSALNQARRKGLTLSNPAEAVEDLKSDGEEREIFEPAEIRALLKAAGKTDWRGMVLIGYHCGPRLHDVANLTWDNIDQEAGTVTFKQEKTGEKVVIVLHQDVVEWLENRQCGKGRPLFPDLFGKATKTGLSKGFEKLIKAAGISVKLGRKKTGKGRQMRSKTFHSLRHSFVSALANNDISRDVRKAISGHSSDSAHERYTHLGLDAQRRAMQKMPSVLALPPA